MQSMTKKIVCFANSRKHAGRCIAGKEVQSDGQAGAWVRPVSMRQGHEISEEEMRYENGQNPALLDIVRIEMVGYKPSGFQSENYVINDDFYWEKTGCLNWESVNRFLDAPAILWKNESSSYYGLHDRVSYAETVNFQESIYLVKPESLSIIVRTEGQEFNNPKRKVRAKFVYRGVEYLLSITDPVVESALLSINNNQYEGLSDTYLCVSLSEPFSDQLCYKLVASIVSKQPLTQLCRL